MKDHSDWPADDQQKLDRANEMWEADDWFNRDEPEADHSKIRKAHDPWYADRCERNDKGE